MGVVGGGRVDVLDRDSVRADREGVEENRGRSSGIVGGGEGGESGCIDRENVRVDQEGVTEDREGIR